MSLGKLLNADTRSRFFCPLCKEGTSYDVHLHAVRWRCCGFVWNLPPIHGGHSYKACKDCGTKQRTVTDTRHIIKALEHK